MTPYQSLLELPLAAFVVGIVGGILCYWLFSLVCGVFLLLRRGSWLYYIVLVFLSFIGLSLLLTTFVVAVYILVDGPHALPGEAGGLFGVFPRDMYRWYWALVTIPFAQIALGLLLGAIGFKWLADLADPRTISTEPQQIAHRRWGFVLLTLLVIGTLYPSLRTLTLSTAQVKTPVGEVSLAASPKASAEKTPDPISVGEPPRPAAVRGEGNAPPPGTMIWIASYADRDRDYDQFFLHGHPAGLDDAVVFQHVSSLHEDADPFAKLVLQPFVYCVLEFYNTIQSQHRLRDQIIDAVESYGAALQDPSEKKVGKLYKDLLIAIDNLNTHILLSKPNDASDCKTASESITSAQTQKIKFSTKLPYLHITLAHLLSSIGSADIGALRLAEWIEGMHSDAQLPLWYRLRAEYELAELLKNTEDRRSLVFAIRNLVDATDLILRAHGFELAKWYKACTPDNSAINGGPSIRCPIDLPL
jgi:hypothetical protein